MLAALLRAARNGRGRALLVLGEPGIGKTRLLADAAQRANTDVIRLDGYESESAMPFATVQRLVALLHGFPRGASGPSAAGPAGRLRHG